MLKIILVRAKIAKQAADYIYSSAQDHLSLRDKPLIKLKPYKEIDKDKWSTYLKENDPDFNDNIRLKTNRGLVVGTRQFIKNLEKQLNRSLKCLPWGRPKKS